MGVVRGTARVFATKAWASGLVMLLFSTAFVVLRTAEVGDGDISSFILHGSALAAPGTVERGDPPIRVLPGGGYDGQFYYRMALDPADLHDDRHGIHLDSGVRRQRIGYPVLAHLLSGGRSRAIPIALVVVNVMAISMAAVLGGLLSRSYGRSAAWGLLIAGYGGLLHGLARDLTEPLAFALTLAALLALRAERVWFAVAAMSAAALTRETALVLPAALVLCAAASRLRRRTAPHWRDLVWLLPVMVWGGWQLACRVMYGAFPIAGESSAVVTPGSAAVSAIQRWVDDPGAQQLQLLLGVVTLGVMGGAALLAARKTSPPYVLTAVALSALLVWSLSSAVWVDDATQLRIFVDIHLYSSVALLTARGRTVLVISLAATLAVLAMAARLRLVEL